MSPHTFVKKIRWSWSASTWKCWSGAGKNIQTKIRAAFIPDDVKMLPKAQRIKIEEWCNQVPLLGFNSGRYDLNLIRENFSERLSDTTGKVRVAKNGNKIMFILTNNFRFLEIINYLGPGG